MSGAPVAKRYVIRLIDQTGERTLKCWVGSVGRKAQQFGIAYDVESARAMRPAAAECAMAWLKPTAEAAGFSMRLDLA